MNRIIKIFGFILLGLSFISCSKEEEKKDFEIVNYVLQHETQVNGWKNYKVVLFVRNNTDLTINKTAHVRFFRNHEGDIGGFSRDISLQPNKVNRFDLEFPSLVHFYTEIILDKIIIE